MTARPDEWLAFPRGLVETDRNAELERLRWELSEARRMNAELGQVFDAEVRELKRELETLKRERESVS
jgi:hypothetical protein